MQLIPTFEITLATQAPDLTQIRNLPSPKTKGDQAFSDIFSEMSVQSEPDAPVGPPTDTANAENQRILSKVEGEDDRKTEEFARESDRKGEIVPPENPSPKGLHGPVEHRHLPQKIPFVDRQIFVRDQTAPTTAKHPAGGAEPSAVSANTPAVSAPSLIAAKPPTVVVPPPTLTTNPPAAAPTTPLVAATSPATVASPSAVAANPSAAAKPSVVAPPPSAVAAPPPAKAEKRDAPFEKLEDALRQPELPRASFSAARGTEIRAAEKPSTTETTKALSSSFPTDHTTGARNDHKAALEVALPTDDRTVEHKPYTPTHSNVSSVDFALPGETSERLQDQPPTETPETRIEQNGQLLSLISVEEMPLSLESGPAFRSSRRDLASSHSLREFPQISSEPGQEVETSSVGETADDEKTDGQSYERPQKQMQPWTSQSANPKSPVFQTGVVSAAATGVPLTGSQDRQSFEKISTAGSPAPVTQARTFDTGSFASVPAAPQMPAMQIQPEIAGLETLKSDRPLPEMGRHLNLPSQTTSGPISSPVPTPVQIISHPPLTVAPKQVAVPQSEALELIASSEEPGPQVSQTDPARQLMSTLSTPVLKVDLPPQIPRQLAEHIHLNPGKTVDVALSPEELGRVKLSVTASELGVNVNILAERPETLDLLRRNIEQLQQELRLLGYENPGFSFQNEAGHREDHADGRVMSTASDPEIGETSTPVAVTEPLSTAPLGGLDLRL